MNNPNINLDWFSSASAVAGVVSKVGFAITAYLAVRALSGDDWKSVERLPKNAASLTQFFAHFLSVAWVSVGRGNNASPHWVPHSSFWGRPRPCPHCRSTRYWSSEACRHSCNNTSRSSAVAVSGQQRMRRAQSRAARTAASAFCVSSAGWFASATTAFQSSAPARNIHASRASSLC